MKNNHNKSELSAYFGDAPDHALPSDAYDAMQTVCWLMTQFLQSLQSLY